MSAIKNRLLPPDAASKAAALSVAANFSMMLLKLGVGLVSGSIAVLSDGIDSAQDMIAAAIVYASVQIGRRPADAEHPFGHGRAETIAAALQAVMIGGGASFIAVSGVRRLQDPPEDIGAGLGLATMLIAGAVNLLVLRYVSSVAKQTRSPAIESDARHLLTNVVQATVVLAGLALVEISGEVAFDAILALALAAYLFWTMAGILWGVTSDVLDASLPADDIEFIEAAIRSQSERIAGFHQLRTRRSGQTPHIDLHLTFMPSTSLDQAHDVTDAIEQRIRRRWAKAEIIIHQEPAVAGNRSEPREDPAK